MFVDQYTNTMYVVFKQNKEIQTHTYAYTERWIYPFNSYRLWMEIIDNKFIVCHREYINRNCGQLAKVL